MSWHPKHPLDNFFALFWGTYYVLRQGEGGVYQWCKKLFRNEETNKKKLYVHVSYFQGEIRATGFNDAVDKFYELLEVNKVCKTFAFI